MKNPKTAGSGWTLSPLAFVLLLSWIFASKGCSAAASTTKDLNVRKLLGNKANHTVANTGDHHTFEVFCYPGEPTSMTKFWSSSVLRIKHESEDYEIFSGSNSTDVLSKWEKHQSTWLSSPSLPWKNKDVRLHPFEESCIGVYTKEPYWVLLQVYRVNYWQVMLTFTGVCVFMFSPKLSRNVVFHYATGVGMGVGFSIVIATYMIQKKMRAGWMSWILGCYSLAIYFLTSLWYNVKELLVEYHSYVLLYLFVTGLGSFGICYRLGPVENPRSLNLIQWTLQLTGLLFIYLSSYHQVASLSLALFFLTWSCVPETWKSRSRTWYHKKLFKPKVKLLTEAEYLDESRIATKKALEELRDFCRSPKCETWKVASRLQSPSRFAEFVEGSPHVTQNEVMEYSHADFDSEDGDDSPGVVLNGRSFGSGRENSASGGGEGGSNASFLLTDDDED